MDPRKAPRLRPDLIDDLLAIYDEDGPLQIQSGHELPSFAEVRLVLDGIRELIFPGYAGEHIPSGAALRASVHAKLAEVQMRLQRQIFRGLHHRCDRDGARRIANGGSRVDQDGCDGCQHASADIAACFLDELPVMRARLLGDIRAAFDADPAATGTDEIVFSYPGPWAILVHRVSHRLLELGAVIVPRMMAEVAHADTGIDIHPGATIGESFFIDHGTGVVIGETCIIGNRVRIYQGVTLGAMSLPRGKARVLSTIKRHPTIEDDVIIYANATILGGDTVIGRGAVIGGNTFITESVGPGERRLA